MSHDLMSENSMFSYLQTPWHRLGVVSDREMGAQEALGRIESPYYEKRAPKLDLDGVEQEYGDFAIVRSPIPSDPHERVVGTVKKNYNILQPLEIAQKFDEEVCQNIETIGFLGTNGEKMFTTWELPQISINRNDFVKLFGFVACGFDGLFGANLNVVTERVICRNTWNAAISESEHKDRRRGTGRIWSGRHTNDIADTLGIWMHHVQERALNKSNELSDVFNAMADVAIKNQNTLNNLLGKIYPSPRPIPPDYPKRLLAKRQEKFDKLNSNAIRDRNLIEELYNGKGVEITNDVWGLWNCVTEAENHHRIVKKDASYSLLLGNRAKTMDRAFNVLYAFVERNK